MTLTAVLRKAVPAALFACVLTFSLSSAFAQNPSRSAYNTQVDNFTITFDGGSANVSKQFGFGLAGNQLHFTGIGNFKLDSVGTFFLLYNSDPGSGNRPFTDSTAAIGNIPTAKVWTAASKSNLTFGWDGPNGSHKAGQFAPSTSGFTTGNVFKLKSTSPAPGANLFGYGWHVYLLGTKGTDSPFKDDKGKFVKFDNDGQATGFVYQTVGTTITAVPEPAFYQMSALLALGGLGFLRLRKERSSR